MSTIETVGVDELVASIRKVSTQLDAGLGEAAHREAAEQVLGYIHPGFTRAEVTPAGFTIGVGGPYFPGREVFLTRPLTAAEQTLVDTYTDHLEQLLDTLKGA